MSHQADIIVAGAGPAGSTAAKLLADRGYRVLLIDRATFPRHKTCAAWINRLAVERFPYLERWLDELMEVPFFGVTFYDATLKRAGRFSEVQPSGYLSIRSKFDDGLRRIAVRAGAEFLGGCGVVDISQGHDGAVVRLADGREFSAQVVVGADGAASRVAMAAGLRRGWGRRDYVICANADVPFDRAEIRRLYGHQVPLLVYFEYEGIQGYGWVFPKDRHICIGVGGMLANNREIRPLFSRFFHDLKRRGHLPAGLSESAVQEATCFDVDPVGAVYRQPSLTRGRVVLIGDAAGFVSGTTGEGIYPGMVSAEVACGVIRCALASGSVEQTLERFNQEWRVELGDYVKRLPGGERSEKTRRRLGLIFRSSLAARLAGRVFLYGEPLSFRTLKRSVWA